MKGVELYARVRRAFSVEGLSRREAGRRFGLDPRTVKKMLAFSVPPGYRRSKPPVRPKLGPFTGIIDQILEEDTQTKKTYVELPTLGAPAGLQSGGLACLAIAFVVAMNRLGRKFELTADASAHRMRHGQMA